MYRDQAMKTWSKARKPSDDSDEPMMTVIMKTPVAHVQKKEEEKQDFEAMMLLSI